MDPTTETPDRISTDALQRLLDNRKQFLSFLQHRVGSAAVAEDILQNAFIRSIEKGGTLRDEETVIAWFYRILRNAIIDHYRQQASSQRALEEFVRELDAHEAPPELIEDEICRCVTAVMETLKPEYKQALKTVDLDEGKLSDLAKDAGITEGNAAVRVHRAREALKKQVKTTCGMCAEHGCVDCHCASQTKPHAN
jgi:RNA polymerase sigma-70 factor (ECF subfamily)